MGIFNHLFGKKEEAESSAAEKKVPAASVVKEEPEADEALIDETDDLIGELLAAEEEGTESRQTEDGEYAVRLLRCGSQKVNVIKWIRYMTGCSLSEAKATAENGGMIGFVKGRTEALKWYYRFAEGDSAVEFTRNFLRLKPYGCFRIEVKNLEMGKRKYKIWEDNVGYMYAAAICEILQDRNYAVRIEKNEYSGDQEVSVVLSNLFRKADFSLIGGILKDVIGMNEEEYNALLNSEDGVLRGLNQETADYIRSVLPLAREEEPEEYKPAPVSAKTEKLIWKLMTNQEKVYLLNEANDKGAAEPWLLPSGTPAVLLEEDDESFLRVMDPYSAEGEMSLLPVKKEDLKDLLREMAARGQTSLQAVHDRRSVIINLDHFLPSPSSQIEYNGRLVRRRITDFISCLRRYDLKLPKRERKTDRGDMIYCMAVNTKMNLMREIGLDVFYTIGETAQKKDGITLYTQNAWNIVQEQTKNSESEERSFCAPGDLDTAVIPSVGSFYNMVWKKEKTCLPLFTSAKGARRVKEQLFADEEKAAVVVACFDDVREAASLVDGLVIDMNEAGFLVDRKSFDDIENMRKNIVEIPISLRFRNSGNPSQKREPVFTIEDIRRIAGENQEERVGCRKVKYDESLRRWRMTTQLDEKRLWFLSMWMNDDGRIVKYCLDYEGASDSHYEFTDEAGIRKKLYKPQDEYLYLDQIFAGYVLKNGGEALLRALYPFITAQFHYD